MSWKFTTSSLHEGFFLLSVMWQAPKNSLKRAHSGELIVWRSKTRKRSKLSRRLAVNSHRVATVSTWTNISHRNRFENKPLVWLLIWPFSLALNQKCASWRQRHYLPSHECQSQQQRDFTNGRHMCRWLSPSRMSSPIGSRAVSSRD